MGFGVWGLGLGYPGKLAGVPEEPTDMLSDKEDEATLQVTGLPTTGAHTSNEQHLGAVNKTTTLRLRVTTSRELQSGTGTVQQDGETNYFTAKENQTNISPGKDDRIVVDNVPVAIKKRASLAGGVPSLVQCGGEGESTDTSPLGSESSSVGL